KHQNATGDAATFTMRENTVTLVGNVTVTRGADVLRGQRLVVDLTSGVSKMDQGRVEGLFQSGPRNPPDPRNTADKNNAAEKSNTAEKNNTAEKSNTAEKNNTAEKSNTADKRRTPVVRSRIATARRLPPGRRVVGERLKSAWDITVARMLDRQSRDRVMGLPRRCAPFGSAMFRIDVERLR